MAIERETVVHVVTRGREVFVLDGERRHSAIGREKGDTALGG